MADNGVATSESSLELAIEILTKLKKTGGSVSDDQLWSFVSAGVGLDSARLP